MFVYVKYVLRKSFSYILKIAVVLLLRALDVPVELCKNFCVKDHYHLKDGGRQFKFYVKNAKYFYVN